MFGLFGNTSMQVKLWSLIVLNSSIALFLAGVGLLAYQGYQERSTATRELTTQAEMIARNSAAALSFADERAAKETLTALEADSRMVQAAIYDLNGRIFASYARPGASGRGAPPVQPGPAGVHFEDGFSIAFQPITLGNERLGMVFLKASRAELRAGLRRDIAIVCVVLLVSLALALLLSSRMRRSITDPIGELCKAASRVSVEKDYSVRALRQTGGEIGVLIDSFNEMLSRIEVHARAREAAEESLRQSDERYALAVRGANDGLWDWNLSTGEIYYSPRWIQMMGYSCGEIRPSPDEWFSRFHPADRDRVLSEIAAHQAGVTKEFVSEYRMRHRDGSFIWMLSRGIAVKDAHGKAVRMAGSQTDITEGKIADPLTGLSNRLFFLDRLERSLEAAERESGLLAVLVLDLDGFKLVNDSLGHAAGDALLMEMARRIRLSVDCKDSAAVARLGGDEFAILLTGIRSPDAAVGAAQRILKDIGAPLHIDGRKIFASLSIGIALNCFGRTPEDLLRNADTAMYYAKLRGRSRFELFDDGMRECAVARLEMEAELRRAIDEGQFVVYYQPQVSISEGRLTGYEALVRWNHPGRGIVPPGEFLPIAEETDLIIPLGRWVLEEACRQTAEWQRMFPMDPPLTISVNVSFRQLIEPELVEDVRRILADSGLAAGTLRLEMTESTVMTKTQETVETLRRLKNLNIGLEIDDFGTGYSSLSYLNQLPFDTLKIDRSFVKDRRADDESWDIVGTILELARSLNLRVVAEGVETAEQFGLLKTLGCDLAQGYYLARPADAKTVQARMQGGAFRTKKVGKGPDSAAADLSGSDLFEPAFVRAVTGEDGISLENSAPYSHMDNGLMASPYEEIRR